MKSFGQNKSELLLPHNLKHPYLCLFLFSSVVTERAKYERQAFVSTLHDKRLLIFFYDIFHLVLV